MGKNENSVKKSHLVLMVLSFPGNILVPDSEMSQISGPVPVPSNEGISMSDFRQKLFSAGLSAVVLLGACAPLTAMAAQTNANAPQTQQTAASNIVKADKNAAAQGTQTLQPSSGNGQISAPAPAGQAQTQTVDQGNENDAAQQAQLAAQAKITEAEAIAAAQAAYPGSTVTVKELDGENGKVIYDLKVQPADGSKAFEAAVDAVTGKLLAAESDGERAAR